MAYFPSASMCQSSDRITRRHRHALYTAALLANLPRQGRCRLLTVPRIPWPLWSCCSLMYCFRFTKGEKTWKDPIYQYLIKDDFGALLHERPLYLLNRSLLKDDQDVFRTAKELYRTRNKIVHRAELSSEINDGSYITVDKEGAKQALDCVLSVFRWFGVDSSYSLKDGFIEGAGVAF